MTLLDFYTAGATEYVAVLFTTVFGAVGLLELNQRDAYRKYQSTLSWTYLLVAGAAAWSVARIVGTEFLLVDEMKSEGLLSQYQSQVAAWDPLAASRLVGLLNGPQFYILYFGAPLVIFWILFKVWLRLVHNYGFTEFLTSSGLKKVFSVASWSHSSTQYEKAGVNFDAIEKQIGLKFKDHALVGQAFLHDSYLNEHQKENLRSNERLEFLGDALINLAAAHHLYKTSDAQEGVLTETRKTLVSNPALAKVAGSLHLGDYIIMGSGELTSGGREKESILAGCFEALVGAIFLQFDFDEANQFLLKALRGHPLIE